MGPLQPTILLVIIAIGVVGFVAAARSIRSTFDPGLPAAILVPAAPTAITVPPSPVTIVLAEPVPIR